MQFAVNRSLQEAIILEIAPKPIIQAAQQKP